MIIFGTYIRLKKHFRDHHFWTKGYYVNIVGFDEAIVRQCIQNQELNELVEAKYDSDLGNSF